jgi:catechol 2,3-dioxygenase
MDAPNPSASPTFANKTPMHIGAVGLAVRDLDRMVGYYRDAIGLNVLERTDKGARLGAGDVTLLELEHRPDFKPDDARTAGLYHTAFLMPTRGDLARWLIHAAQNRVPLTGASDHEVSEAIYLDDPEGNGIEVYRDRAPGEWRWQDGLVAMITEPLDLNDLAGAAGAEPYAGAPAGLRIGHIHLRVGDLATAKKFYIGAIGLELTRERHGAAFMSSARYHHHVGANVWHSQGAGRRDDDRAGLAWFRIETADSNTRNALAARLREAGAAVAEGAHDLSAQDPWGTRIRF